MEEAHSIYRQDLARLSMDITGMIQFQHLLIEGKVSTPVMAVAHLGIERGERFDGEAQRKAVRMAIRTSRPPLATTTIRAHPQGSPPGARR